VEIKLTTRMARSVRMMRLTTSEKPEAARRGSWLGEFIGKV